MVKIANFLFTFSPGRKPFCGLSWSNRASYFRFSSGLTRKLMLGAGVPRGAAATFNHPQLLYEELPSANTVTDPQ
jgi:hypothetical protein